MQEVLFDYELNPTTWAYLSSLMTIGIFFKFGRFWSVRNLDLAALICLTPGLLLVYHGLKKQSMGVEQLGQTLEHMGYIWLFVIGAFFLIRLLIDTILVRRPLLEPNLSASGLTFTCVALMVFLMANVVTANRPKRMEKGTERLEDVLLQSYRQHGPGYPYLYHFASFREGDLGPTRRTAPAAESDVPAPQPARTSEAAMPGIEPAALSAALLAPDGQTTPEQGGSARTSEPLRRVVAILAHLAVVTGLVLIGFRHFDNIHTGVAVASLYLLLFCTSQLVGRVDLVVPAALLVWAIEAYRRPILAGVLIGLAGGLIYYPLFLLPLWCAFYWRRGVIRFAVGVAASLLLLVVLLPLSPDRLGSFWDQLRQMFGLINPLAPELDGFWLYHPHAFRLPVLAAFVAMCGSLALWPAQKNLGTLLSCSAAVMLGSQFWQAYQGGTHVAWYLPLLLLTIFRPNLEDRVALSALTQWRFRGLKNKVALSQ